jgi:vitamin K-dependent gamma-carboxylase
MVFGFLIAAEGFGAIATGWVKRTFIDPELTFNFIGFDFLQPLTGSSMYFVFVLMGIFGIMVMLGYKYRWSMLAYAVLWTAVYLLQKTSYNNHYYLMMLLCWLMVFLPANRLYSLDAKFNPSLKSSAMPQWCLVILILQVWIVYTYASVAKMYPDWLDGTALTLLLKGKAGYWLIGDFLQQNWVHYIVAYVGIMFDLLIVPLLLWKRTRLLAFVISLGFHLFNSVVFQIGIFPYMSIAFCLFFFSPESLKKRFLRKKNIYYGEEISAPNYKKLGVTLFSIYFIVQLTLPIRHWFIQDNVLWTEEGHRLSWRMMLRTKTGSLTVWVKDKETGLKKRYNYGKLLSNKQIRSVKTKPDLLWQLAQRIKEREKQSGFEVEVYMDVKVSINGGNYYTMIDPEVDLASEIWFPLKHHDWILPSPEKNDNTKDYNPQFP